MTRHLALSVAALLLTLWAYQSVWSAEWVYEDRATLTAATAGPSWQRPVTYWTWQMAPTPKAGHVVNVALHLALSAGLGVLAWRLGLTPFGAWIVALVWLLSPMTAETVAYAKARSEQLVMLGALVAMLSATGRWWRVSSVTGIVLGTAVALGGEPSGVVVFLLVPLTVWHSRARVAATTTGRVPPWWVPAVIAAGLIGGGVLWYGGLRAVINADSEVGFTSAAAVTWQDWLMVQSGAVWYWLLAIGNPTLLTPDADIDRLSALARGMGLFTLVVMGGLAWRVRQAHPVLTTALLLFLVALLPRLLVQTPRSYLNAAQFALPFMGLAVCGGYGAEQWKARWRPQPCA